MTETVYLNLGALEVEAVAGQARRPVAFVNLLTKVPSTIDEWTAVGGPGLSQELTVTASGTDVLVEWTAAQTRAGVGREFRLRLNGVDKVIGELVEARGRDTPGIDTVEISIANPDEVTVVVQDSATGAAAVTAHVAATDPHGDRSYAAGLVDDLSGVTDPETARANLELGTAAQLDAGAAGGVADLDVDGLVPEAQLPPAKIPHIQMTTRETAGPGSPWRFVIDAPLRSAVYIPPADGTFPAGTFEGLELPAPGPSSPSFGVVVETTGVAGTEISFYDVASPAMVVGSVLDSVGTSYMSGSNGMIPVEVYAIETSEDDWRWMGVSPPDGSVVATALVEIAAILDTLATKADVAFVHDHLASGAKPGSIGLRPTEALDTPMSTWLAALAAATTASPVDVVVFGDSTSSITRPTFAGHRPWPLQLEAALGGSTNSHGWRYGWPDPSGDYRACVTNGTQAAGKGTGGFATELDPGEDTHLTCSGQTLRVVWTRQPTGINIEIRDGSTSGTVLATIPTAGTAKSGQITDVALPNGYVFGSGTIYAVAAGAGGTAIVDALLPRYDSRVRVHSASHGGWLTSYFTATPAYGLDLVETVQPEVTIIATGTNDDTANIETRMRDMVAAVRAVAPSTLIVLLAMYPSSGMAVADIELMRTVADDLDCVFVDLSSVSGSWWAPADALHPSQVAHDTIAAVVAGVLTGSPIGAAYRQLMRVSTRRDVNPQTGTAYTVAASDADKIVSRSNVGASTMKWPSDAIPVPVGAEVIVPNLGAGTITHSADTGATLATGSATSQPQGKRLVGSKVAANTWLLTISG